MEVSAELGVAMDGRRVGELGRVPARCLGSGANRVRSPVMGVGSQPGVRCCWSS